MTSCHPELQLYDVFKRNAITKLIYGSKNIKILKPAIDYMHENMKALCS